MKYREPSEEGFNRAMANIKKKSALLELNRYVYARYRYRFPYIKNPQENDIPLYTE